MPSESAANLENGGDDFKVASAAGPLREPLLPGEAESPLLDDDGWPILENASQPDLIRAAQAVGGLAMYGNFLRAALAGIYAERRVAMRLRESGDCELHWGSCDA